MRGTLVCVCAFLILETSPALGQRWNVDQRGVLEAIEALNAATAVDGEGADAYGRVLADGFSRWTLGGGVFNDKRQWVDGIRGWFEDGWVVVEREADVREIQIHGDLAFVRRVVTESYLGPEGERSTADPAALAEVWVREGENWLLLRVDVTLLDG